MQLSTRRHRAFRAFLVALLATCPAAALAAADVAAWAGRYDDDSFSQTLQIDRDGRVKASGMVFSGGDAGFGFHAQGELRKDGEWLTLTLHPSHDPQDNADMPKELEKPRRLFPFVSQQRRFLMDEHALIGIVNDVNIHGQHEVTPSFGMHEVFDSEQTGRNRGSVDAEAVLPPAYRARILAAPLDGHVTRVISSVPLENKGGPGAFAIGPPEPTRPGPPPPPRVWRQTTLEIDLGSADGVFVGMILCVSPSQDEYFWVERVEAHRSTIARGTPVDYTVGEVVSSRSWRMPRR